jgi:hypothetical protein
MRFYDVDDGTREFPEPHVEKVSPHMAIAILAAASTGSWAAVWLVAVSVRQGVRTMFGV